MGTAALSLFMALFSLSGVARAQDCPDESTVREPGQEHLEFRQLESGYQTPLEGDANRLNERVQSVVRSPVAGSGFRPEEFASIPAEAAQNFIDLGNGRIRVVERTKVRCQNQFVERVLFEGTKEELARNLTVSEQYMNDRGYSLRQPAEELLPQRIPTDIEALRKQLLGEIQLHSPELLAKVLPPLLGGACPHVDASRLAPARLRETVELPDGTTLSLDNFLTRVRDTENVLCSIGHSLLPQALDAASTPDFVSRVLAARKDVFGELGLSGLMRVLNLQPFEALGSIDDIRKGIDAVQAAAKVPGPEMLQEVKRELGVNLPSIELPNVPGIQVPDIAIPAMPQFPIPSAPKRTPLAKVKKKLWAGIAIGRRDVVGLDGRAALTVAGTENTQTLRAEADVSAFVVGNEISIISGTGDFTVGSAGVDGRLELYFLGQKAFEPKEMHHESKVVWEDPEALNWNFDQGYSQTFSVGPIPVSVKVGAFARIGLGYRVGLINTQIEAAVRPGAEAGGYAEAMVGISGFLSAGAGAELTVISLHAPLTGLARLQFDDEGYPYLRVSIDSDVDLQMLNGRIYAFAEYPVPFWIAKSTLDIWSFQGPRVNHKIMSWGMDIGRQGARSWGDLLDQNDLDEAQALDEQIQLDNRAEELHKYEQRLIALTQGIMADITREAHSDGDTNLRSLSQGVGLLDRGIDQGLAGFRDRVEQVAQEL